MPASATLASPYAAAFRRHAGPAAPGAIPWLDALRREAFERFLATGLPTPRDEGWLSTNLAPLERTAFAPVPLASAPTGCAVLDPVERALPGALRYVLVDGRALAQPAPGLRPAGLKVLSLGHALRDGAGALRARLEAEVASEHPFALLGVAFLGQGLVIEAEPGADVLAPVVLQHVSTKDVGPLANHLSIWIRLGAGSRLRVVESVSGLGACANLTNVLAEAQVGAGATLRHVRVQREGPAAFHVARLRASLEREARLSSMTFSFGAALSRMETDVRLAGEGASCALDGLYHVDGARSADLVTHVRHAVPHASSRQLVKGVLDGEGRGAFTGRVEVSDGALGTDAQQANHNLLLSPRAWVASRPQLEIYADDVKCSHGATIGRLDQAALFYLESRGLGPEQARELLVHAFAAEVLTRLDDADLRAALDGVLATLLHEARSPGRAP